MKCDCGKWHERKSDVAMCLACKDTGFVIKQNKKISCMECGKNEKHTDKR